MSAGILRALMELFAIIAKGKSEHDDSTRNIVAIFLRQQLNKDLVETYLKLYESYVSKHQGERKLEGKKSRKRTSLNSVKVLRICTKINEELARKEKVFVVLRLLEFIHVMEGAADQENEFVQTVAETFNIQISTYKNLCGLVKASTDTMLDNDSFLVAAGLSEAEQEGPNRFMRVPGLRGKFLFLRLEEENLFLLRYFGNENLYLNGQVLQVNRSHVFRQGATIRGGKINTLYYSDVIKKFLIDRSNVEVEFRAENVSYYFKGSRKQALHQFSLKESSGNLVGIMGASGSGKSTLLNVLNGNYAPTFGEVSINGINIHSEKHRIEGVIGYVAQDDLLIEELTVFENLFFNAKLCFKNKPDEEITELVEITLNNLGLIETKDLRVGSPLQKTISGGQRKRLNIALELIREPSVLFVDEPTSGLSSRDSENIMDLLKELTLRGKLVFVVIHQPSSEIFKMFDGLFILDQGGYPIYYGNPVESLVYFKRLVNHVNQEESECPSCGNVNPEQLFNIIESRVVDEYGKLTDHRKITPREWNNFYNVMIANKMEASPLDQEIPTSSFSLPGKIQQFKVFVQRDVLSKLGNTQYMLINFLEAPVLALVLSFFVKYYQAGHGEQASYIFRESENLPQFLFISVIVALFLGLTVSAEEIIRDRKILKREEFLNLSKYSYLSSKIGIMFTLSAIQMLTYVIIGNAVLEIRGMTMSYWLILFSTSCFTNLLGLNISASFNSAKVIYILIPILIIPQLLFSGVIVKFDKLYPLFASQSGVPWIGNIMASRWSYEALAVNQYKNNAYEKHFFDFDKERKYSNWKKDYWVKELQNKVNESRKYLDNGTSDRLGYTWGVLRNELLKEQQFVGGLELPNLSSVTPSEISHTLLDEIEYKLDRLFEFYRDRYNKAAAQKEEYVHELMKSEEGKQELIVMKDSFMNESLQEFVTNKNELEVIVEYNQELVQKSDLIYLTPRHSGFFDAHFYAPSKPLLGKQITTYSANLLVLWGMTLLLVVSLFYDGLRKVLKLLNSGWKNLGALFRSDFKEAEFAS